MLRGARSSSVFIRAHTERVLLTRHRTAWPPSSQAVVRCADPPEDGNGSDNEEQEGRLFSSGAHRVLVVSQLNQLWKASSAGGEDMRLWMAQKWGKRYVIHLKRRSSGLVLEISGFNMEDGTARMSEDAYALHLQKVCTQMRALGISDAIGILEAACIKEPHHFIGIIDSPAEIPLRPPHSCESEWQVG